MDLEKHVSLLLQRGVDERVFPGAVWAVGGRGEAVLRGAAGVLDPDQPTEPMSLTTVFDVASLTKIMAVWASAGILWEQGYLDLDEPLGVLIPVMAL
ncbi:serine hydrolase [Streptosporangium canum]|uniref:serine hydrolase n=1 Tax=Streptosporangium canum TaxID=324952 RepID=UPI00367FF1A8